MCFNDKNKSTIDSVKNDFFNYLAECYGDLIIWVTTIDDFYTLLEREVINHLSPKYGLECTRSIFNEYYEIWLHEYNLLY